MSTRNLCLAAAALSLFAAAPAWAQDDGPTVDFNIGAASDYVFRGVSQTNEDPQIFGGADVGTGLFYAGTWVSNVDFGDGTDAEYDLYAGFKPTLGAVTFDVALLFYGYIGAPSGADYDYFEAKVSASMALGPASFGAGFYYSPDSFGPTDDSYYYEVNATLPVGEKLSFTGALGYQAFEGPGDYTTWNIGVGYALNDHLGVDLRYHDTDKHKFGEIYGSRAVISLKATF